MTSTGDAREVGWYSWDEWHHVRKLLYSFNDTPSQIKGINMVRVWKSRLSQRVLPVSVDLTAALVAASIGNATCVSGNEYQAQMSSAMSIIRFVNGVTDQHQTGLYAQSVQLIADKINIPDWMVDLRHEATHAKLPGFDLLKSGLIIALNWLDAHYWEETASKLIEKEISFSVGLNKLLGDYADNIVDIVAIDTLKTHHKNVKEKNKARQRKVILLDNALNSIYKYLNLGNLKRFISILLQNGFFVLNIKQLEILELEELDCGLKISDSFINQIDVLSDLWRPLFQKLLEDFSPFMHILVSEMIATTKAHKFSSHAHHLIAMYTLFRINNSCSKQFVSYLFKDPSKLSFQLLSLIIETGEFSPETTKKMKLFLNIFDPVLNALTSKSKSFDHSRLEQMGTEASLKGKQLLDLFKEESVKRSTTEEKSTSESSWLCLDEESCLPPLGEFSPTKNLFNLDADYSTMDFSCTDIANDELDTESDTIGYDNDGECYDSANGLFLNSSENVCDKSAASSSTEEYIGDKNDSMDEDVDFNIQEKDSNLNTCFGSNFLPVPSKSFKDCDVSKICFF